jgi:hypothetical protein
MGWINYQALWKIVGYGLIAGAGLPALFAFGLRALAWPSGGNVIGLIVAVIIALDILAALGWSVYEVYQIGHPAVKK